MNRFIAFWLDNAKLNHTFLFFILALGIFSYQSIPKEVYPVIKLKSISVYGSYTGASIDTLDKMAVDPLEEEFKNISGIKKMDSYIDTSGFSIYLTLQEESNPQLVLDRVKTGISNAKADFPSDMDEPTASVSVDNFPLIQVSIASNTLKASELIEKAKELKKEIAFIPNISTINIFGDQKNIIEFTLDQRRIDAYGLSKTSVLDTITSLSYLFPVGKVEETGNHFFISTTNGKKTPEALLSTKVTIDSKQIYLRDIVSIKKTLEDNDAIVSTFNGKKMIQVSINKSRNGNAIELAKQIKDIAVSFAKKHPSVEVIPFFDTSEYITNRLNNVVSSILFGILLVGGSIYFLVNRHVAFVVVIGIPTSIIIGVILLYFFNYTINMMTLLGVLIILGILVDDAIVVAENIQQHLEKGKSRYQAAIDGTKEVALPVIAASATTFFAFLPMLLLSGEMGMFLKMIPIAVSGLIFASLLESFVFLPLHGSHILKKGAKELNWNPLKKYYSKCLTFLIQYKKSIISVFLVITVLLTLGIGGSMRYQLFPTYDVNNIYVRGKFAPGFKSSETFEKITALQTWLLANQKELYIKTLNTTSGYSGGSGYSSSEQANIFEFSLELYERSPQNIVNRFITPYFSFNYDPKGRIRPFSSEDVLDKLNKGLKPIAKNMDLTKFIIEKEGTGITDHDVEIEISHSDNKIMKNSIKVLQDTLKSLDGISQVGDTAQLGIPEVKIGLNTYGEFLGLTESSIANQLAPYYLYTDRAKIYDTKGVVKLFFKDAQKDDASSLNTFELTLNNGKHVYLKDVVTLTTLQNYESLHKVRGIGVKTVFANVDNINITSKEALILLEPIFEKLKNEGVRISLRGEQEESSKAIEELSVALSLAIGLIFLTLLLMFGSFKNVFIILSIIPLSVLGGLLGHLIIGINLSLTSFIGMLGLAGVVINDAIIMLDIIRKGTTVEEIIERAASRLRPIIITSLTTFIGLSTLIFFATGQAKILQPIAISLGFGLIWGTLLTLFFLPGMFLMIHTRQSTKHTKSTLKNFKINETKKENL